MQAEETTPLLKANTISTNGLSVFFAVICVVDVFGVFPVVALPKPIIDCGFYGILVILIVCSVQVYTAVLLGKCWNLAEEINPTIFLAAQNLELLGLRISNDSFDVSFCYWIIILGTILCPVLWLGSPKDMKVLCTISVILVTSVYVLTCGCLIFTSPDEMPQPETSRNSSTELWKLLMSAYGIVAFQFDIHPTILTIQMDMVNKTKLSYAIIGGFGVSLFMFGTTSIITAVKYGSTIKPSILETLPTSISLHFAATLVAVQLCLTSAVSNSALYQHMEDCLNISREFNHKRCILRTILTILAIVIAESVPRFDLVMSLIGGTLIGPLVFVLPPLFYLKVKRMHREYMEQMEKESFSNIVLNKPRSSSHRTEYDRDLAKYYEAKFKEEFHNENSLSQWVCNKEVEIAICLVIIISSIAATCCTTYLNISTAALSYTNWSKPCIYNVSNALLYL
ncbi:uncharacterized protein LOC126745563 isoform X2 [Anthonomus grandis grandis]|uniref:uncharacterized protein LOC126745563 isoform X2 n=1 Tax=Anthonomus grandis grandis TaxID=2921223 RepID=UPI0021661FF8|nr:uncharacterized protein LOC126745563 isoform X2 [Anthonomus grandis grandis]